MLSVQTYFFQEKRSRKCCVSAIGLCPRGACWAVTAFCFVDWLCLLDAQSRWDPHLQLAASRGASSAALRSGWVWEQCGAQGRPLLLCSELSCAGVGSGQLRFPGDDGMRFFPHLGFGAFLRGKRQGQPFTKTQCWGLSQTRHGGTYLLPSRGKSFRT